MVTIHDVMNDPRLLAARAAKLAVIACDYRGQAARLRLHAIEWEIIGDAERAADFAARADVAAADAVAIEAVRAELIGRFAPTVDLTADECGVYA